MERHLLGALTLSLLLLAALLHLLGDSVGVPSVVPAAMLRVAIMLGVIWIAVPNVQWIVARTPGWLLGTTLLLLAMMVVRPRSIVLLLPVLIGLWLLGPNWFGKKDV